ncbi:MAG TPA: cytochrome b N-terminal domain-containing protein [Burkholderiales bacterium]|nr:cytochrome b N-terminal domain-containing protein [Burkholderiales bacterium]
MLKLIHGAGRWVFQKVEAVFNAAFGDKLNPLYYLGPISYFLFWIVVASGLYLYAFFDTGVKDAFQSVEDITHGQRYIGGVMRSLHRYASDGMVFTMLLHLLRHFFFDRYRSFRWFSWVTGVVVLWLVYASGINGYMLPWDRLAQFTVIATAEWFDWLPMFGGTLVRNFIFPDSVNDRLFSLLSFIHIGIPLAVLFLLWVHVQRVPHARTNPPLPIGITLTVALVALSLVKPALSQAPADLSQAVTTVELDWFYLATYPLIYAWSPGQLWALVGGATLVFLVLPWLPPKKRLGPKEGYHIMVHPDNRIIPVREGETVLDACLRENMPMPFECRNGGCGVCKGDVVYGKVDLGAYQPSVLSEDERRAGRALFCLCTPLSDVEIVYEPKETPGGIPVQVHTAKVERMLRLTDDVMQIFLRPEQGEKLRFYAGQYINILLPDGDKRAFSFASAPHAAGDLIELQVRWIKNGKFTTHVFTEMKEGDSVHFEGPLGAFFLREDSQKPIIFVAGATGFAPVKSMVEHAFHTGLKRQMILYWGVRGLKDLYLPELPQRWEREHSNFKFVPVLSDPRPEDNWSGRSGLVHEAILQDFPDLAGHQIYACGSVKMVEAAHPAFVAKGLSPDDCFSDAFKLSPHVKLKGEGADMVKLGGGA